MCLGLRQFTVSTVRELLAQNLSFNRSLKKYGTQLPYIYAVFHIL
jgi:hypothetical protein